MKFNKKLSDIVEINKIEDVKKTIEKRNNQFRREQNE